MVSCSHLQRCLPRVAVLAVLFIPTVIPAQNRFARAPVYTLGGSLTFSAVTSDFNGDHHTDMLAYVAPNGTASTWNVTLALGNSSGGFGSPKVLASIPNRTIGFVGAGDFNGDGKIDFALALSTGVINIYLGNGDGTFRAPSSVSFGSGVPTGILVGKITNDTRSDLILSVGVNSFATREVIVFPGNGNGTFGSPKTTVLGPDAIRMALGDLNRDGLQDLAMSGFDSYQILLSKGDGTFNVKPSVSLGGYGNYFQGAIVDYDGDGIPDLVLANAGDTIDYKGTGEIPSLFILRGYGDGTFHAGTTADAGNSGMALAVGDLSGDGRQDLAVFNHFSQTIVVKLASSTTGLTNAPVATYAVADSGRPFAALLTADVNGDGKRDLLLVNDTGVQVFLNEGGGRFAGTNATEIQSYAYDLKASDLNHDGTADAVIRGHNVGNISGFSEYVYLALGNNSTKLTTKPAIFQTGGGIGPLGLSFFNSDGNVDILTRFGVMFNNGAAQFSPPHSQPANIGTSTWTVPDYATAAGDLNGDGKADLVSVGSTELTVSLGNGDGTFKPEVNYSLGGTDGNAIVLRDLNKDGKLDAITANHGSSTVSVFLGKGDGTFQAAKEYSVTANPVDLAVGDFNGDGNLDIAVISFSKVSILLGNGTGGFRAGTTLTVSSGGSMSSVAAVSLRGNGLSDLAVAEAVSKTVRVFYATGTGSFGPAAVYHVGASPLSIVSGDFNGDGAQDLAVALNQSTALPVLYNQGGTHIAITRSNSSPAKGQAVTFKATLTSTMGNGTPTGTIAFKQGSSTLATITMSGGAASWTTSTLSTGMHAIYAVYSGNSTFNSHTSVSVAVTVH